MAHLYSWNSGKLVSNELKEIHCNFKLYIAVAFFDMCFLESGDCRENCENIDQ